MTKMLYDQIEPQPIGGLGDVRVWLNDPAHFKSRARVLKSNLPLMAKVYGKPHQQYQGSSYLFDVWRVEHQGFTFWLLAAEGRGCEIEVEYRLESWKKWPDADVQVVLTFLEAHLKRLEG